MVQTNNVGKTFSRIFFAFNDERSIVYRTRTIYLFYIWNSIVDPRVLLRNIVYILFHGPADQMRRRVRINIPLKSVKPVVHSKHFYNNFTINQKNVFIKKLRIIARSFCVLDTNQFLIFAFVKWTMSCYFTTPNLFQFFRNQVKKTVHKFLMILLVYLTVRFKNYQNVIK